MTSNIFCLYYTDYCFIIVSMSEFDRQMKIFAEKMENPDEVVEVCSVAKYEYKDGDVYYFLTDDDRLIKVTSRESER